MGRQTTVGPSPVRLRPHCHLRRCDPKGNFNLGDTRSTVNRRLARCSDRNSNPDDPFRITCFAGTRVYQFRHPSPGPHFRVNDACAATHALRVGMKVEADWSGSVTIPSQLSSARRLASGCVARHTRPSRGWTRGGLLRLGKWTRGGLRRKAGARGHRKHRKVATPFSEEPSTRPFS